MNSWEILGITRTKDKKIIKKAYAKKLAEYHPEEEPEKFLEIQQAFKRAMEYTNTFTEQPPEEPPTDSLFKDDMGDKNDTDKTDDIFNTATTENYVEDKIMPAKALMELKMILESKEPSKLKNFINGDMFNAVKTNPFFIRSLVTLLPNYPINNQQINLLRKSLGIKNRTSHAYIYHSELNEELDKLEALFNERQWRITPLVAAAIAIILIYIATMLLVPIDVFP